MSWELALGIWAAVQLFAIVLALYELKWFKQLEKEYDKDH